MRGEVMDGAVKYVWRIAPPDYLPPDDEFRAGGYTFKVPAGGEEIWTIMEEHEFDHSLLHKLEEHLRAYLDAAQLKEFKAYTLKRDSRSDRRGTRAFSEPAVSIANVSVGNVRVLDLDGAVISDEKEKQARNRKEEFSSVERISRLLIEYCDDTCLQEMLKLFKRACTDAEDELIHLYKVRDVINKWFLDREKEAHSALGFTHNEWSGFGRLCNKEPLIQSRHGHMENCRPADASQLDKARHFSGELVIRYLDYVYRERHNIR